MDIGSLIQQMRQRAIDNANKNNANLDAVTAQAGQMIKNPTLDKVTQFSPEQKEYGKNLVGAVAGSVAPEAQELEGAASAVEEGLADRIKRASQNSSVVGDAEQVGQNSMYYGDSPTIQARRKVMQDMSQQGKLGSGN